MGVARRGLSEVLGSVVVLLVMLSGLLVYTKLAGRITAEGSMLAETLDASITGVSVARTPDGVIVYNPTGRYAEIEYIVVNSSGTLELIDYDGAPLGPGNATTLSDPQQGKIIGVILRGGRYFAAVDDGPVGGSGGYPSPAQVNYTELWFLNGVGSSIAPYVLRGAKVCGLSYINLSISFGISISSRTEGGVTIISVTIYPAGSAAGGSFTCPVTGECNGTITLASRALTARVNASLNGDYGVFNMSIIFRSGIFTLRESNFMAFLVGEGPVVVEPRSSGYLSANVTPLSASASVVDRPDAYLYGDPSYPLHAKPVDTAIDLSLLVDYGSRAKFTAYVTVRHYSIFWGLYLPYGPCPASSEAPGGSGGQASS